MGLVARRDGQQGYPMAYGCEHGYLLWAPGWVKHLICRVWNRVNCTIYGHDRMGVEGFEKHFWPDAPRCINCSSLLMVGGKYPTREDIEENNRIVYEQWDKLHLDELGEE
jgi:hypothetical protein